MLLCLDVLNQSALFLGHAARVTRRLIETRVAHGS
jgi:hypothetical protein